MKASEMAAILKKVIARVGDVEIKVYTGRCLQTPTKEVGYDEKRRRIIISTEEAECESD